MFTADLHLFTDVRVDVMDRTGGESHRIIRFIRQYRIFFPDVCWGNICYGQGEIAQPKIFSILDMVGNGKEMKKRQLTKIDRTFSEIAQPKNFSILLSKLNALVL